MIIKTCSVCGSGDIMTCGEESTCINCARKDSSILFCAIFTFADPNNEGKILKGEVAIEKEDIADSVKRKIAAIHGDIHLLEEPRLTDKWIPRALLELQ